MEITVWQLEMNWIMKFGTERLVHSKKSWIVYLLLQSHVWTAKPSSSDQKFWNMWLTDVSVARMCPVKEGKSTKEIAQICIYFKYCKPLSLTVRQIKRSYRNLGCCEEFWTVLRNCASDKKEKSLWCTCRILSGV